MSTKPETRFRQNQVLPFLKTLKNTFFFAIQQAALRGTPDFILVMAGKFVALELKADDGNLSKLQKYNLDQVEEAGGATLVARPRTWPSDKLVLQRLDQGEM